MSFAAVLDRLQTLENPYPGLRPFETQEAHLFFGRDRQVAELLARLERNHFVAVVGVSGSGKSSLVRAGLIPALDHGRLAETSGWRIAVTRPAGAPFENLAQALGAKPEVLRRSSRGLIEFAKSLPAGKNMLLLIDQFEELFRYKDREPFTKEAKREHAAAASDAAAFVQLLLAAKNGGAPVYIVITMRSDYLGDCAAFRDLPETLNDSQYLVPRMLREERRQAIEGPLGPVSIAPSLVQQLLNDVGDEPDQLPILQHALMRTWGQWRKSDPNRKRGIELKDYEAIGGFEGALNKHANELVRGLRENAKIAETIFRRLTARGPGNRERRDPARLRDLWAVCDAQTAKDKARVETVIDRFRHGEATFLTPRDGDLHADTYIDLTHESLIRNWKKLGEQWLLKEEESAKTLLDLLELARKWKAGKREPLIGVDLSEALRWNRYRNQSKAWAEHWAGDSALELVLEFLRASRDARDEAKRRERERNQQQLEQEKRLRLEAERREEAERKAAQRTRWLTFTLALLLLGAVVILVVR